MAPARPQPEETWTSASASPTPPRSSTSSSPTTATTRPSSRRSRRPSPTAPSSGSPIARAAPSVCRATRSPTSTSAAPTRRTASASAVDPRPRLMPVDLLDRRLLFVTGKGGVGKTTVAASLALLGAQHGKRTLVCEVDAKGNLSDFYESGKTAFEPIEVQSNLWAMSMETEESLKEYLRLQLRVPLLSKIGPLAHTFDFVATAAPGVKEILTV